MKRLLAKDIMHPRVSLSAKTTGDDLVKKLLVSYPTLPVVNENLEVIGIVSDHDVLNSLKEKRTIHDYSAESLMGCGHTAHGFCKDPITISWDNPIDDIIDLFLRERISMLPVVENRKLVGIVTRTNIITALAEEGFWPEADFQKRAA